VASARKITVKSESGVTCPTCSFEIPVENTKGLPRNFSVLCPNCGGRKSYLLAQVHDHKQDAETAQMSSRPQFGMRGAIDDDLTAESIPPKSRLSQLASWLLQ